MSGNGFKLAAAPPTSSSNGETCDDGRILQLSEIIVTEMRASQVRSPRAPEIYRVPEVLLAADKGAYQPRFLSLGPYHRGGSATATEEMRRNDGEKPGNLAYAVEGGGPPVVEYMQAIASIQADARSRYMGGVVDMEWDAFCRMLLLDAFQLITLLEYLGFHDGDEPSGAGESAEQEDCMPRTGVLSSIGHDLMMLENQIPFFVAQRIYGLRHGDDGNGIAELAWRTIRRIMCDVPSAAANPPPAEKCQHLVHLCHAYLKPSNLGCSCSRGACAGEHGRFRRATEYHEAGVRFRQLCSEDGGEQCPLLDVAFSNGALRADGAAQDRRDDQLCPPQRARVPGDGDERRHRLRGGVRGVHVAAAGRPGGRGPAVAAWATTPRCARSSGGWRRGSSSTRPATTTSGLWG